MPDETKRRGLGRGLSALMADLDPEPAPQDAAVQTVPIDLIRRNPEQPRRVFDPEQIADLTSSIRERGVLQPIVVRRDPARDDLYQIVAGERRWRAAQAAQLHEMPVVVKDLTDSDVLEIAIIENVQRVDLNPLEEAHGFQQLIDRFGHTQEQVAQALGKSRSHVANTLRLASLPAPVQDHLREGRITAGHARAALAAPDPVALADAVVAKGLTVRAAERMAKAGSEARPRREKRPIPYDADTKALQDDIAAAIGMGVRIAHTDEGSGSVTIHYRDMGQLDQLCEALSRAGMDLAAR